MNKQSPSFLFVPVSSPEGIGEYMRCVVLATQIKLRWPTAKIHFVLSAQVGYLDSCPFEYTTTPSSPTKHVKQVNDLINTLSPDVVIFDASGRKSQLACAKSVGAKVVFISQHKKKRARGLKIGRLRATDSHWVVQPDFALGPLSRFETLKLKVFDKQAPINTGVIFSPPSDELLASTRRELALAEAPYLLFNAGSGGHLVGDKLAADILADAAIEIAQQTKIQCVMVFGPNYPKPIPQSADLVCIASIENDKLISLLSGAKAAVLGGGDTLLQAIALNIPTLAIPVSKDQPPRIEACASRGLVSCCENNAQSIVSASLTLLSTQLVSLTNTLNNSHYKNGVVIAMEELERLLES